MAKTYRTGLVITGDASDGVKAINLTRDQLDKLNKTGQKTRTQMRETSAESERFTASLGHVAHKAAAWTAAFVGVNAIMNQFNQQLDSVDRIHKLNLRIGASTEALSEYAYVAELSGTNIEQLAVAWQRQTRRIAEAAQGTGVAKAALEELNLSAKTLRTLAPEDQFMAIAGALENVAEKGDRLRLANAIFDSEGAAAALQIINQGTDAMDRMIERAQKLGATVFQDQANNIASYNDAVTDMRYAWEGVNRVLAANLAESATNGLVELAEIVPTVTSGLEYLDEAMIAVMAVTAGKGSAALAAKTKELAASAKAARVAAESELYLAKQAQMRAVQDQAAAQRSLANAASMEARSAAGTRLARANQQVIATTKLMDAATANYQRTATLAGRAAAGLRSTMAFFGGPLGVVTMAVTAFALLSPRLTDNESRIETLAKKAKEGAEQLSNMANATNQLSIAQAQAGMVATAELLDEQVAAAKAAGAEIERLEATIAGMKIGDSPMQGFAGQVRALEKELELAVKTHSDLQANVINSEQAYKQAKGAIDEIFSSQDKFNAALMAGGAASDDLVEANEVSHESYLKLKATLDDVTRINQQYYDQVQEINQASITQAQKAELITDAHKKRVRALEELNKKQQTSTRITKDEIDKNQQLIQSLGDEIELMQLSGRERAIQTELRKLDADATESQILAMRHLAGVNYDQQQAALAAKEELKLAAEQTNVWADITENAVNSVDNSFRELFRSGLDGWDDFWDQMLDTAKDMLAELAYTLIKQQLWVNVGMSVTGQGGAVGAASSAGNLVSTGKSVYDIYTGNNSVVNTIGSWLGFGGASAATTTAGYGAFASALPSTAGYLGMGTGATTATSGLVGLGGTATTTAGASGAASSGLSAGWGAAGMAAAVIALPFIAQALDSYFGGDKTPEISLANMSSAIRDMYEEDVKLEAEGWRSYQNYAAGMGEADVENYHTSDFRYNPRTNAGNILQATYLGRESPFSETSVETPFGMLGVGRAAYMGETNLEGVQQFLNAVKNIDEDLARYLSVQQIESISESLADWVYDGGGEGSTVAAEIGRQLRERLGIQLDVIDQELAAFVNDAGEGISQQNLERFSAESQVATLALAMEGTLDVVAIGINQFKALSLEGENTAQTITRTLTQTMAVMDVLDAIELNFSGLGDEMLVTADRLVKLSGGIDALTSSANYYYQNYFTEQERAQIQVDSYTAMLSQFNAEFDTALSGRDDLRAFVESLDLTSESGQSAYVAAMQLAPALVELERALTVVNEPARQLAARGQELQSSINDVVWGFMSAGEQLSAYQRQITQFNGTLGLSGSSAINSGQSLSRYLESLDLSTESGQSAAESALAMANAIKAVEAAERAAAQARQEAARASAQAARNAAKAERDLAEQRLKTARSQLVSAFQSELSSLTQQQSALESAAADAKLGLIAALRNEISSIAQQEGELQQQIENAKAAYAEAIDREISAQQAARDEAESTAKAWRTVVDQLSDARSALLDETLTPAQQQFNAQAAFNDALSQAWAGSMEAFQSLPTLAQSAQAAMLGNSATGEEYRLATAQLVAQLDSAGALASTNATAQDRLVEAADQQLSALQTVEEDLLSIAEAQQALALAEQELSAFQHQSQMAALSDELEALEGVNRNLASLDAARAEYEEAALAVANSTFEAEMGVLQEQLDWLQRLNGAVLSLPEALAAYLAAGGEALPKFADGGIATGPTSGYRVELHGTEAVIPLKHGSVPVSIDASGMGDELRALRTAIAHLNDDMRKIGGQQIKSAQRLESLIRKWDIDGQPEVRSA